MLEPLEKRRKGVLSTEKGKDKVKDPACEGDWVIIAGELPIGDCRGDKVRKTPREPKKKSCGGTSH